MDLEFSTRDFFFFRVVEKKIPIEKKKRYIFLVDIDYKLLTHWKKFWFISFRISFLSWIKYIDTLWLDIEVNKSRILFS
jgi:hypothetical protein